MCSSQTHLSVLSADTPLFPSVLNMAIKLMQLTILCQETETLPANRKTGNHFYQSWIIAGPGFFCCFSTICKFSPCHAFTRSKRHFSEGHLQFGKILINISLLCSFQYDKLPLDHATEQEFFSGFVFSLLRHF